MSVHREGENPSSMDGVPDLRDHNSIDVPPDVIDFLKLEGRIRKKGNTVSLHIYIILL